MRRPFPALRNCSRHLPCLMALLLLLPAAGAVGKEPAVVRDLAYGEALFHFYEGDYFNAITRLQVARKQDLLQHHQDDARLLLGGLYLSYGLHQEAGEIFSRLLDQDADAAVRNRARLYLARIWYQRGYLDQAEDALARMQGEGMAPHMDAQRRLLMTYVRMSQGRYEEAAAALGEWRDTEGAGAYGRYNLGISLLRSGQEARGLELLDQLGRMDADDDEMRALRDKANLALGYTWLQQDAPLRARPYLERVQLDGLASGKALLGLGWAESAQGRHEEALRPWLVLSRRQSHDSAAQEARLAIPYTLLQLGAENHAITHYEQAIAAFQEEALQLEALRTAFAGGGVAENFLQDDEVNGMGWYWRLERLPPGVESRYLYELLSRHEFQEVLKNYRDLKYLTRNLTHWAGSMGAFEDMLKLRRDTYAARAPRIQASYERLDLEQARVQRDAYVARLAAIEENEDVTALATAAEQALRQRLDEVEAILGRYPGYEKLSRQREKQRLLRGVLLWRESQDYKARLWNVRKHLRQLDTQIARAEQGRASIAAAQREAPHGFEGFDQRIAGHRRQIAALQARLGDALGHQEAYLQRLVLAELQRRSARLDEYLAQARYGLARVYDQLATRREARP